MNNRSTVALLAAFFVGLGLLWWASDRRPPAEDRLRDRLGVVLPGLLGSRPDDIRWIQIVGGPTPVTLERREGGRWQVGGPFDAAADRAEAERLVRNLGILRRLPGSAPLTGPAAEYGLATPARTVHIYGNDRHLPLDILELGRIAAGRRYVRRRDSTGIEVVDARALAAVDRPAEAWRARSLLVGPPFAIASLSLKQPGRELHLARAGDHWRIVRPFRAPADTTKVEALIAELLAIRAVGPPGGVADGVRDLAPYGLDEPALTIELANGSGPGSIQRLEVGRVAPDPTSTSYARLGDQDDVVLVPNAPLRALSVDPWELRSNRLTDFSPAATSRLRLTQGGRTVELVRDAQGWAVAGAPEVRGDKKAVRAMLGALANAEFPTTLPPADAAGLELVPPSSVVTIWEAPAGGTGVPVAPDPESPPALVLELGRHDPLKKSVFARTAGDPRVLALPDTLLAALPRGPLDLRDKTLLKDPSDRLERLTIDRADGRFVVEPPRSPQRRGNWTLVAPVTASADPETLTQLVPLLAGLQADTFVAEDPSAADLARFGLDAPALRADWTISPASPSTAPIERSLRVGGPVSGGEGARYAMLQGNPIVFTLGVPAVETLGAELRDRRIFRFDPAAVARVEVRWPGRTLAFNRSPRPLGGPPDWKPTVDSSGFDLGRINPMLAGLSRLSALRYVHHAGPIPPALGLSPPRVAIRVELDRDGPRELRIGSAGPIGGFLATGQPDDRGAAFLIAGQGWGAWVDAPRREGDLPDDIFEPGGGAP